MSAQRLSSRAGLASAAFAGLMLLTGAAFAQNHFEQSSVGEAYNARAQARAHGQFSISTPNDFVSSHVCINGYRWITRDIDPYSTPAQNAIPVRC